MRTLWHKEHGLSRCNGFSQIMQLTNTIEANLQVSIQSAFPFGNDCLTSGYNLIFHNPPHRINFKTFLLNSSGTSAFCMAT